MHWHVAGKMPGWIMDSGRRPNVPPLRVALKPSSFQTFSGLIRADLVVEIATFVLPLLQLSMDDPSQPHTTAVSVSGEALLLHYGMSMRVFLHSTRPWLPQVS
jgi:hypothetical protein